MRKYIKTLLYLYKLYLKLNSKILYDSRPLFSCQINISKRIFNSKHVKQIIYQIQQYSSSKIKTSFQPITILHTNQK